MDVLQTWVLVGIPGLVVAAGLFTGRDRLRAWFGYAVLAALTAVFLTVEGGAVWGGAIGLLTVGLVATGRGTAAVENAPEEQATRDRLTHAEHA